MPTRRRDSSTGSTRPRPRCRRSHASSCPGGSPGGAALHLARTVCRRAERDVVSLGADAVDATVVTYVNRLSDLLFVLARLANAPGRSGRPGVGVRLEDAYAACARLARSALRELPGGLASAPRPHAAPRGGRLRVRALADDIADEGDVDAARRHARLDEWTSRLHASVAGTTFDAGTSTLDPATRDLAPAVFTATAHTIRSIDLPIDLFDDLVSAFRQDITVKWYDSWSSLFDYCRRSANPVGRLVLRIGGWRSAARCRVGRGLHRAAAHELLAGPGDRLAPRPAVRARRGASTRGRVARRARSRRADRPMAPGALTVVRAHARAVRPRPRRVRRRERPAALRASRDVARRAAGARPARRVWLRRVPHAAVARDARRAGARVGRGLVAAMSRPTSFYYAFLSLSRRQRDAIVAVWDFCRAVDDTVDEAGVGTHGIRGRRRPGARRDGAAAGVARRAERLLRGPGHDAAGPGAPALDRALPAHAPAVPGSHRRRRDGSGSLPLRDVRRVV